MTSILIYMLVGGRAFVMGAVMLEKYYTLDGCDDVLTDDNINILKKLKINLTCCRVAHNGAIDPHDWILPFPVG